MPIKKIKNEYTIDKLDEKSNLDDFSCGLDDMDEFLSEIWNNLDENNKVAIAVRYIDLASGEYKQKIINKYI